VKNDVSWEGGKYNFRKGWEINIVFGPKCRTLRFFAAFVFLLFEFVFYPLLLFISIYIIPYSFIFSSFSLPFSHTVSFSMTSSHITRPGKGKGIFSNELPFIGGPTHVPTVSQRVSGFHFSCTLVQALGLEYENAQLHRLIEHLLGLPTRWVVGSCSCVPWKRETTYTNPD
jgi:hypothetical protein